MANSNCVFVRAAGRQLDELRSEASRIHRAAYEARPRPIEIGLANADLA